MSNPEPKKNCAENERENSWNAFSLIIGGIGALFFAKMLALVLSPNIWTPPAATSPEAQKQSQQDATNAYWKVTVSDLIPYRFFLVEDPNEPAGRFFQRVITNYRAKVQTARVQSTEHVDKDLVAMVKRHLDQDESVLQVLEQIRDYLIKHGLLNDATPVGQQFALGEQIINGLNANPNLLDEIEDSEARTLMESILDADAMQMEQFREIELLQARLQERYPSLSGTSFPLPVPTDDRKP